jgi:glycosyltransferase involved in cell wall biosynthesis
LHNTSFIGQVEPGSIADVYDRADIYLNGSEIDNQPLSILEAFSCGLPVVTTDAGGIPDIVIDRTNGMLVPCGDYSQMADRSLELLANPDLTRRLIQQGRNECSKYSWEAVRGAWMSVYCGLGQHSAKGAKYDSQGQARSEANASPLVKNPN